MGVFSKLLQGSLEHLFSWSLKAKLGFFTNIVQYLMRFVLRPYSLSCKRKTGFGESFSEAGQDLFVSMIFNHKRLGSFVEIGSQDPIKNNNTFILERKLGWLGVAFDKRQMFCRFYNWRRKSNCVDGDATCHDYAEIFAQFNLPRRIDFLQIDLDPAEASLAALCQLPHGDYRFSTIVFEHDSYQYGHHTRDASREFLLERGYHLLASDVRIGGKPFEDWWIDPLAKEITDGLTTLNFRDDDYFQVLTQLDFQLQSLHKNSGAYGEISPRR